MSERVCVCSCSSSFLMFVFVRVCIRFTNKNEQLKIEICINISKKEVKKLDILLKIRGLMKVINRGVN